MDMLPVPLPPRTKRFWTNREEKILREHYPAGGLPACAPLLPGREEGSIYQHAAAMGLRRPRKSGDFTYQRYSSNQFMDEIIKRGYASPHKNMVAGLAKTLNRPRWWISKRAAKLGLVAPRTKEAPWSESEIDYISARGHISLPNLKKGLGKLGFHRTETAIAVKLKRIGASVIDPDQYSATGLSKLMGVDGKTVTRWIEKKWLRADRAGTDRVPSQGGDMWTIRQKDVARFVVENLAAVDIRKVDKDWFVDLLVNEGRQIAKAAA